MPMESNGRRRGAGRGRRKAGSGFPAPSQFQLPPPGDPYVDADGRIYQPERLPPGFDDPVPLDVSPEDFRPLKRQNLDDLGAEPKVVSACGAVLSYTVLGIGDREICFALGISAEQLDKIRAHAIYADIFNQFLLELISANSHSLQARIASYAHGALTNVARLAKEGKKEEVQLTASRDLLDRAGTKPKDQVAIQATGLKIALIGKDSAVTVEATIGGRDV